MNREFEMNQKRKKIFFISVLMILFLLIAGILSSGTLAVFCTEIGFRQDVDIEKRLEKTGLKDLKVKSFEFYTPRKEARCAEVGFFVSFESTEIEKYADAKKDSDEARELLSVMRNICRRVRAVNYVADLFNGWKVRISSPDTNYVHIEDSQGRMYIYDYSAHHSEDSSYKSEYLRIDGEWVIYDIAKEEKFEDTPGSNYSNHSGNGFLGSLKEEYLFYSNYKNKSDRYDVYDYRHPEDFYDDNYDDFESYEDAETYFEDAWNDY